MDKKLSIGIVGYGNLGRGVELSLQQNPDMELVAIFTRRQPSQVESGSKMVSIAEIEAYKEKIDVLILCGGSSTDLPEQGPMLAKWFHTVDSFDTHAKIPAYFEAVNKAAISGNNLSLISTGWDPGLFSLARILGQSILPVGKDYTFWGKGVSQGHSDAIRRVKGVKDGKQYTVPVEAALEVIRNGETPNFTARQKHERICYVVAEAGADLTEIERTIKEMPYYFDEYNTTVYFITEEELKANHAGLPHGGLVLRTGTTGQGTKQQIEFNLKLGSNPEFTASVLVAYARAIGRMSKEGQTGARTVLDIPFAYLSSKTAEELRRDLL